MLERPTRSVRAAGELAGCNPAPRILHGKAERSVTHRSVQRALDAAPYAYTPSRLHRRDAVLHRVLNKRLHEQWRDAEQP